MLLLGGEVSELTGQRQLNELCDVENCFIVSSSIIINSQTLGTSMSQPPFVGHEENNACMEINKYEA